MLGRISWMNPSDNPTPTTATETPLHMLSFKDLLQKAQTFVMPGFQNNSEFKHFMKKLTLKVKIPEVPDESYMRGLMKKVQSKRIKRGIKTWKKKWIPEEKLLLVCVIYYLMKIAGKTDIGNMGKDIWKATAMHLNKEYVDCAFKFHSMMLCNSQMEAWGQEEDQILSEIVSNKLKDKNDKLKWINIAKDFYLKSKDNAIFRNEKTCREHWINNLDPNNNRSNWTDEEDLVLLQEFLTYQGKWSIIATKFKGRNCYALKNRFDSICRKFNISKDCGNIQEEIKRVYKVIYDLNNAKKKVETKEEMPNPATFQKKATMVPALIRQQPMTIYPGFWQFNTPFNGNQMFFQNSQPRIFFSVPSQPVFHNFAFGNYPFMG